MAHASVSAVSVQCRSCADLLGRLCRDGLGVSLRIPGSCPHHPLGLTEGERNAVWDAWLTWAATDELAEVRAVEEAYDLATSRTA